MNQQQNITNEDSEYESFEDYEDTSFEPTSTLATIFMHLTKGSETTEENLTEEYDYYEGQ